MNEIKLETKLVGDIQGLFFIPSYQRGYRWGKEEVERLLDDIYSVGDNINVNYCLQPIVVREREDKSYEVIDGQQRLTTLFLIYKYMHFSSSGFFDDAKFTIEYETRKKSADFLNNIDVNRKDENIDFFHIYNAYSTIESWFTNKGKKSAMTNINTYFDERVNVIWYEVGDNENSTALFTRLNIGKIALTNAELVKALFLSRDNSEVDRKKQEEISLQWDNIERMLHEDSLWYFLTNKSGSDYQTRIDIILDLKVGKTIEDKREKYFTFFKLYDKRKSESLDDMWLGIQKTFLILKDWYEDHELYHKIGYLIASGHSTLADIFAISQNKKKHDFREALESLIKESVEIDENYGDLSYENASEAQAISRLLLLFNVESVRQNGEHTQWFPFDKLKFSENGRATWSLEHIYAQQSEGMKNKSDWKEWIRLHLPSVRAVDPDNSALISEMEEAVDKGLREKEFNKIQGQVLNILSAKGNNEYLHSISNLALLNVEDNAALSNSTFDVKRNRIIEMDKGGQYIPFCTRMVFLKYYTPSALNQLHFWGQADRIAYVDSINEVLRNYLNQKIIIGKETE
jgi:hypothetical protein